MKNIIYVVMLFFLLFIGIEIYFYNLNNGNIIFYIQNQSDKSNLIENTIQLNDDEIFLGKVSNENLIPHEVVLKKKIGQYKLLFHRKDLDMKNEVDINLFLVKWVVIDMYSDQTKIEQLIIPPLFQ